MNTSAATPANSQQNPRENLQKSFIQSLQFILTIASAWLEVFSKNEFNFIFYIL
jgi:hypothetical protein